MNNPLAPLPSLIGLNRQKFAQNARSLGYKGGCSTSDAKKAASALNVKKAQDKRNSDNRQRLFDAGKLYRVEGTDIIGCKQVCLRMRGDLPVDAVKLVVSL